MSKRREQGLEKKPWTLLLWTAVAGLIFGLIGFGEVAEDWLRVARNSFHQHKASGQVIVVRIDDPALHQYGNWPWARRTQALLVDKLSAAGVRSVYYDINFSFASNKVDDRAFADALARSGRVTLLSRSKLGPDQATSRVNSEPLPMFMAHANIGIASVHYNYQNAVTRLPYGALISGKKIPSFAAALAHVDGDPDAVFPLDYSVDVRTIPNYSAADVLNGTVDPEATRRKGRPDRHRLRRAWRSLFHPRLWAQLRCVRSCDRCRNPETGSSARSRMAARFLHRPCRRRGRRAAQAFCGTRGDFRGRLHGFARWIWAG